MAMQRSYLENLSRADLQKLCKDHGVKANLKTETLIELLQQCASADPGSSRRRVPTRSATRGLERSNSQMSLDDLDPENDENAVPYEALSIEPQPPKQEPESEPEPVQTRSKKANQLTKLGVGRPMAAGGSGARSPSKPPATTKKATRASRSLSHDQSPPEDHRPAIKPSGHRSALEPLYEEPSQAEPTPQTNSTIPPDISQYIDAAIRPLTAQIRSLEAQVITLREGQKQMDSLRSQQSEVASLRQTVEILTVELNDFRQGSSTVVDKGKAPVHPSTIQNFLTGPSSEERPMFPRPSLAPGMLGKRSRDSTSSDVYGVVEEGDTDNLTDDQRSHLVSRPKRKRARLTGGDTPQLLPAPSLAEGSSSSGQDLTSPSSNAPPKTPLPSYFNGPTTPPPRPVPLNDVGFGMLSTPTSSFPPTIHSFPPEPPASPSPHSDRIAQAPLLNPRAAAPRISPIKPHVPHMAYDFSFGAGGAGSSEGLNSFMHPGSALRAPSDSDLFNFNDMGLPIKNPSTMQGFSTMYGTETTGQGEFGDAMTRNFWNNPS